jgi:hypothetical protein
VWPIRHIRSLSRRSAVQFDDSGGVDRRAVHCDVSIVELETDSLCKSGDQSGGGRIIRQIDWDHDMTAIPTIGKQ